MSGIQILKNYPGLSTEALPMLINFGTSEGSRRIPEDVETGFSGEAPYHVFQVFRAGLVVCSMISDLRSEVLLDVVWSGTIGAKTIPCVFCSLYTFILVC